MKKKKNLSKWFLMLVLTTVSFAFSSCSSDDDDNKNDSGLAKELVGTYTGNGGNVGLLYAGPAQVKVTSTGENSIKVVFTSPTELTGIAPININLQSVDGLVTAPAGALYQLTYSKSEKVLRVAGESNFFEGTKN